MTHARPCARACHDLADIPSHINRRYRRLALVSLSRHVDRLDAGDTDTLLVSCNWLLWQKAVAERRHCLHFEALLDDSDPAHLTTDHYLRACDWMYMDGVDVTVFRGVSLGRKVAVDVAWIILEWDRLTRALEALVRRFRPEEIVYFDYQAEISGLPPSGRFSVVAGVAAKWGIPVTDRRDPPDPDDREFPDKTHILPRPVGPSERGWKARGKQQLLRVFEAGVDWMSRARRALDRARPAVLMLATHRTAIPLLERFRGGALFVLVPAGQFPNKRKLRFLARSWARGVLLVSAPSAGLGAVERDAIRAMARRLEQAWRHGPAKGSDAAVQAFVRDHFLKGDRAHELAARVTWADRILDRYAPTLIFADGMLNSDINIFMELARLRGIPVATTWHSPILQKSKIPIFGNDPRIGLLADRSLTWGRLHEDWLDDTGATCTKVRTGHAIEFHHRAPPRAWGQKRNALILQFAVPGGDVAAKAANEYACFVHVVRLLRDLGYTEIRLKLHPSRAVTAYYRGIAEFFDLPCAIVRDGPFEEHLRWADFVIGPIYTGALVETLSVGKPYFPLHISPSSLNPAYLKGCRVFGDLGSLRRALLEETPPDQRETLNHLTSLDEHPDPVGRTWAVLREMASAPAPRAEAVRSASASG